MELEYALSGPMAITASISPETHSMQRDDGSPLFDIWGTLIFVEEGDVLRGGGILTDCTFTGQTWDLEIMGFTGYLHKMPLVDTLTWGSSSAGTSGNGVDPLEVVRAIWENVQSKPNGNLQVTVDSTTSPYRVGSWHNAARLPTEPGQGVNRAEVNDPIEFAEVWNAQSQKPVAATGKQVFWQYGIYWYDNVEAGSLIQELSEKTPFDFVEEYRWADSDKSEVIMRLKLGTPRIGTRKNNLGFVLGDNIYNVLTITQAGDEFSNSVHYYGSGEGAKQLRSESTVRDSRLRRAKVEVDTSINNRSDLKARAQADRIYSGITTDIDSFNVLQHDNAPLGSFAVGDDVFVRSEFGWQTFEKWCRITALRVDIDSGNMTVTCRRSDTFTYSPIEERFHRP
ncbi:hypothetical protein ACFYOC_24145 [Nocardiopsis alba]|uniref:hypothetical protein n=1 Tax=Nocardiopsis alba TaxID=53437 RepID=UPI003673FF45